MENSSAEHRHIHGKAQRREEDHRPVEPAVAHVHAQNKHLGKCDKGKETVPHRVISAPAAQDPKHIVKQAKRRTRGKGRHELKQLPFYLYLHQPKMRLQKLPSVPLRSS